jgi:hypothetical protein
LRPLSTLPPSEDLPEGSRIPVPEEEPNPEFDAFWEYYLEAHEKNDPQMIRENTEWWHRMRWERYGIPG